MYFYYQNNCVPSSGDVVHNNPLNPTRQVLWDELVTVNWPSVLLKRDGITLNSYHVLAN